MIQDNPTGWGPNTIPAQFKDMVRNLEMKVLQLRSANILLFQPYQPFSKSEDWARCLTGLGTPTRTSGTRPVWCWRDSVRLLS